MPCAGQKYRIKSPSQNTLVKQFTHTASLQPGLLQGLTIRPPIRPPVPFCRQQQTQASIVSLRGTVCHPISSDFIFLSDEKGSEIGMNRNPNHSDSVSSSAL
jgi:hypothetical protein